jgi:hypothetical protein
MRDSSEFGPSPRQDLIGGLLAVALGLYVLAESFQYPMGSMLRMGPGFFPCVVATIIVLLGLALTASSFRARPKTGGGEIRLRSVFAIGFGIVLFALLLERVGLIPATLTLVMVSSLAEPRWRPRRAAMLALAMTTFIYVLFILVLHVPITALKW